MISHPYFYAQKTRNRIQAGGGRITNDVWDSFNKKWSEMLHKVVENEVFTDLRSDMMESSDFSLNSHMVYYDSTIWIITHLENILNSFMW